MLAESLLGTFSSEKVQYPPVAKEPFADLAEAERGKQSKREQFRTVHQRTAIQIRIFVAERVVGGGWLLVPGNEGSGGEKVC